MRGFQAESRVPRLQYERSADLAVSRDSGSRFTWIIEAGYEGPLPCGAVLCLSFESFSLFPRDCNETLLSSAPGEWVSMSYQDAGLLAR